MLVTTNRLLQNSVKDNYLKALKDPDFVSLVSRLNLSENEIMKYTTKLQNTVEELKNCKNCPGLAACKNKELGCVNYPQNYNNHVLFSYIVCRYKKEQIKKEQEKVTAAKTLELASLKDIDKTDKNRYEVLKWVTNFIKEYDPNKRSKGLYLHGNFGCGKTYILSAMANELTKKHYTVETVYFPTLLRDLKNNFDSLGDTIDYLSNVDILIIDDIGAEKVTDWGRDEILGTILQTRMNNLKTTFFTSNFTLKELERHLSNNGSEPVKSSRIIERIKFLCQDMEMISKNYRN